MLATVASEFPAELHREVIATLDQYAGDTPAGRARVQLAILAVAGGDVAKVREYTADARRDFRDVLYWAEDEAGPGTRPAS